MVDNPLDVHFKHGGSTCHTRGYFLWPKPFALFLCVPVYSSSLLHLHALKLAWLKFRMEFESSFHFYTFGSREMQHWFYNAEIIVLLVAHWILDKFVSQGR